MKYNFKNTKTGEVIEKSFPMMEVPESYTENGVKYERDYKASFIIPKHMKAV